MRAQGDVADDGIEKWSVLVRQDALARHVLVDQHVVGLKAVKHGHCVEPRGKVLQPRGQGLLNYIEDLR